MKTPHATLQQVNRDHVTRTATRLETLYALTYQGELCGILDTTQLPQAPKYKKHTWSQIGTARSQAAKYNREFGTDRFGVAELTIKNSV